MYKFTGCLVHSSKLINNFLRHLFSGFLIKNYCKKRTFKDFLSLPLFPLVIPIEFNIEFVHTYLVLRIQLLFLAVFAQYEVENF